MRAGQAGVEAALVEEDEPVGVDLAHDLRPPPRPGGGDVGPLLLAGVQGFFFRRRPARRSARHSTAGLNRRPTRCASIAAYSASVASGRSDTSAVSTSGPAPPSAARPPRRRSGARRPSRACRSHPFTVPTAMPNRSASTRWLPSRRSCAASTRSRRSTDSAMASDAPKPDSTRPQTDRSTLQAIRSRSGARVRLRRFVAVRGGGDEPGAERP